MQGGGEKGGSGGGVGKEGGREEHVPGNKPLRSPEIKGDPSSCNYGAADGAARGKPEAKRRSCG